MRATSLSDAELDQIVGELAPRIAGATVGKATDLDEATLVLELGRDRLLLSAHPRASRLHLTPAKATKGAAPRGFSMLLRKRLGGLRLAALRMLAPGERVVILDFGPGRDRLVAELTGPHANVLLLEPDDRIVSTLRPTRSTTRPLAPGDGYTPPPAPTTENAPRWRGLRRFGESPGVAERVAEHFCAELVRERTELLRERRAGELRRTIDRLERRERALLGDLERARQAAVLRKWGDLLLASLHSLKGRGAESAVVPDLFEDGAPLTIPLDPSMDARTNAARYYHQHKRMSAGRDRIEARLTETRDTIVAAQADLARVPTLTLEHLERTPGAAGARPRTRRAAPAVRLPYREFVSVSGATIRVGRSAADNDTLTFRHARGNDLWLHTRDAPGSHVVVPLGRDEPVSEATLVDAATLAAYNSPLRAEAQVDVMYSRVKNLRKPRGAAPGAVFVSESKTIRVRMEPSRLERLLSSTGQNGDQTSG